jgi:hypothetical protein
LTIVVSQMAKLQSHRLTAIGNPGKTGNIGGADRTD